MDIIKIVNIMYVDNVQHYVKHVKLKIQIV